MMRQGSNSGRRARGRTNRKQHGGGQSRNHTFDSSGPDGRVRGNARQVYEKYLTLARDASSAGDRVAAEAYYQHAEHYFRILSDSTDPQPSGRRQEERQLQINGDDGAPYEGEEPAGGANGSAAQAAEEAGETRRNGAPAKEAGVQAGSGPDGEGEAPQRTRRGRPRKPRSEDDSQAAKQEETAETEEGPAVN